MTTSDQQGLEEQERRQEEEEESAARMLASLGASYDPCRKHPAHSVYTDAQGRQAWHNCPECLQEAKTLYADPKTNIRLGNEYEYAGREYWNSEGKPQRDQQLKG